MVIRRYTSNDLHEILRLFYFTVHSVNARDYSAEQLDAWAPASFDSGIWNDRLLLSQSFVAVENDLIVGFGSLTEDGWIDLLYTHKSFQRKGVGSALLAEMVRSAKAMGMETLHVTASITARPFFEHHNFRLDWEQEKAHHGSIFKTFVMSKSLFNARLPRKSSQHVPEFCCG